jgi:hypothetical protein
VLKMPRMGRRADRSIEIVLGIESADMASGQKIETEHPGRSFFRALNIIRETTSQLYV